MKACELTVLISVIFVVTILHTVSFQHGGHFFLIFLGIACDFKFEPFLIAFPAKIMSLTFQCDYDTVTTVSYRFQ